MSSSAGMREVVVRAANASSEAPSSRASPNTPKRPAWVSPPSCAARCSMLGALPWPGTTRGSLRGAVDVPGDTRTWPSPSGAVSARAPGPPDGVSRRADSPMRSNAPGAKRTGRVPTRVPARVVPFVEPRSATETRPPGSTVTAQCSRDTSGSSRGTSASAERPMWIWPPCSRCTPPASGPATTCSWVGASSSSGWASGSAGAPRDSTAPSVSGGSPRVQRWVSRRSTPANNTIGAPDSRLRSDCGAAASADTAEASADATAARAVPAGAVTSTSQLAERPRGCAGGPSGSTTVSRICIAVSGPFCPGTEFPPPRASNRPVLHASSHLPLTTRPGPGGK